MEKDAGPFLQLSPQIKADFFILHLAADCAGLKVAYLSPSLSNCESLGPILLFETEHSHNPGLCFFNPSS